MTRHKQKVKYFSAIRMRPSLYRPESIARSSSYRYRFALSGRYTGIYLLNTETL